MISVSSLYRLADLRHASVSARTTSKIMHITETKPREVSSMYAAIASMYYRGFWPLTAPILLQYISDFAIEMHGSLHICRGRARYIYICLHLITESS
jgi:hypothetical protein